MYADQFAKSMSWRHMKSDRIGASRGRFQRELTSNYRLSTMRPAVAAGELAAIVNIRSGSDWGSTMNSDAVSLSHSRISNEAGHGDSNRQKQARELAIESLVKETLADPEKIRRLYDAAHARLAAQARIKTYVSVIATRLVRVAIQKE
jgi:hypothetical protein